MIGKQKKLVDAQRWKRVWVDNNCEEDELESACSRANEDRLCWFLLEKVTDGRDTDGQFLNAEAKSETRLSCKLFILIYTVMLNEYETPT